MEDAVNEVKGDEERRHEYMVWMAHEIEIREEGREEGRAEGREEGFLNAMAGMVRDRILTVAEAAKRANLTPEEFAEKTGLAVE